MIYDGDQEKGRESHHIHTLAKAENRFLKLAENRSYLILNESEEQDP